MRRALRAALAATALSLAAVPGAAVAGEATSVQMNPAHTGAAVEPSIEPPLRLRWYRRLPDEPSYPLIAAGRVFVTAPNWRRPGARLLALSAATGRTLWSRPVNAVASAAYWGGRVLVNNGDHVLRAYAARSGRQLWERRVGGDGSTWGPPVAVGGVLYAVVDGALYALDARSGAPLWTTTVPGYGDCTPAVVGDRVYAAFSIGHVYAFTRAGGAFVWPSTSSQDGGCITAAVYRGRIYARDYDGYVYEAGAGRRVGTFPDQAEPAFAHGIGVFLGSLPNASQTRGGILSARDVRSGRTRWRFRGDGHLQSSPLIVNRTAYVGSGAGHLYGLDLRTGRVRWRGHIRDPIGTPDGLPVPQALAAGDGVLVVPGSRGLFAFD